MRITTPTPAWRTSLFFAFLILSAFGLVLRLFWLTVIEEPTFAAEALEKFLVGHLSRGQVHPRAGEAGHYRTSPPSTPRTAPVT